MQSSLTDGLVCLTGGEYHRRLHSCLADTHKKCLDGVCPSTGSLLCCVLGVVTQGGSPLSNQENDCSKSEEAATAEMPDYERCVLLTRTNIAVNLLSVCLQHVYTIVYRRPTETSSMFCSLRPIRWFLLIEQ